MKKTPSVFDIIGPVMIGPSSSHTAGAVRLGLMARAILGEQPTSATLVLHGSFAQTHKGHGTDRALVGGLLGFDVDDERIANAFDEAKQAGMEVAIQTADLWEYAHPNTARIEMRAGDRALSVTGSSVGGGSIVITQIDDYAVHLTGAAATLIIPHKDEYGVVAHVTSILAAHKINIASMSSLRESRGEDALMVISVDGAVTEDALQEIRDTEDVYRTMLVQPLHH